MDDRFFNSDDESLKYFGTDLVLVCVVWSWWCHYHRDAGNLAWFQAGFECLQYSPSLKLFRVVRCAVL